MELSILLFVLSVTMPTVTSQIQNVRVPPGALVEFEFEFINPKPGQSGGGATVGSGAGMGGQAGGSIGGQTGAGMAGQTGAGMSGQSGTGMSGQGMTRGQRMMLSQMMRGAGMSMARPGQMSSGGGQMMGGASQPMGGISMMMGGASQMMPGAMAGTGQQMSGGGQMMPGAMAGTGQQMSGGSQMMPGAMAGTGQPMSGGGQMMPGAGPAMRGGGQRMAGAGQAAGGAGQAMTSAAPGSPIQALLSNMARMALALRRIHGMNQRLPPMEEPCPCDAECCTLPMEPRRVLPVLSIPMTMHPGCCGCVECPLSLSPVISGMIQVARMSPQPPPRDM